MATSSILESVRLTSSKAASIFVDALEEAASMSRKSPSDISIMLRRIPRSSGVL